jgi:hypothetical protein
MRILHRYGLVSENDCKSIVDCIRSMGVHQKTISSDSGVIYYRGEEILETNDFVYGLLCDIGERVKSIAQESFGIKLIESRLVIFETLPGHTPEEHADSQNMDGTPKDGCSDFVVSAVVYFNDEFSGGELVFPKMPYSYRPIAGSCVIFPSDISYSHYVDSVLSGSRLVFPLWFRAIV